MKKNLIICGPTATGKTSLGINLAQKFNGEILSADSRQIYQGMDVGTGKDLPPNPKFKPMNHLLKTNKKYSLGYYLFGSVPVWLLDIVSPNQRFSVADYLNCACPTIDHLYQKRKLPLLVGGTGFYIKALVEGIDTLGIPPNWPLREKLEKQNLITLQKKLRELSPKHWDKMTPSDQKNPRRLIRAIEINQSPNKKQEKPSSPTFDCLVIVLTASLEILDQRIDKRVEARIEQGIIREIENLLKKGFSWKDSALGKTMAYQEFQPFFEKKASLSKTIKRWKQAERGYARRQITWFKKAFPDKNSWFDIAQAGLKRKTEKKVEAWLKKKE